MKVTTEKLPKSLLSLQIELDRDRFEKGLDQAARRLSQKYPIHGFRPGKAPRFIIERTFGRSALIEEASEDLINKAYRDVIAQEHISPVGPPNLEEISSADPFTFRITVPVPPTVNVGDYHTLRATLELDEISDSNVEEALEMLRDKHVVLKELDESRPAQTGDQLKVKLVELVDGNPIGALDDDEDDEEYFDEDDDLDDLDEDFDEDDDEDEDDAEDLDEDEDDDLDEDEDDEDEDEDEDEDDEIRGHERTLDLVEGRLVDELYAGLIGVNVGDKKEITAQMPEDHANEQVRGKEVVFKVEVLGIQERLLPEWDELTTLENFEGDLEALRAKTRADLEKAARTTAERKLVDSFTEQLVAQTEYDIPDVTVRELAHELLHDQERQFSRYGITLEQMLQYRGKTHDQAIDELMPEAERQTKLTLALREVVRNEGIDVTDEEIGTEVERLLLDYDENQRDSVRQMLSTQLRSSVANIVVDRKLRERIVAIATGEAPAPTIAADAAPAEPAASEPETPATEPETAASDSEAPATEPEASATTEG